MRRDDIIRTLRLAFIGEKRGRVLVGNDQKEEAIVAVEQMDKENQDILIQEVMKGVPEEIR